MSAATLYDALAGLPDPRSRHGQIHPLPAVLGLIALAMLMGRTGLAGIARFGRQYGTALAHALGFRRGKTPAVSTLSRTLRRLDAAQVEAILAHWLRGRIDPDAVRHVSLDGKVLRGSHDGELPGQHLVAAYAPQVRGVLAQVRVDSKTNEHKAALGLLGLIPVRGKVVVGDAMFCQRDLAEAVIEAGGDYVLVAKGNQSHLQTDIGAGFGFEAAARAIAAAAPPPDSPAPAAPGREATSVDKGHGRREKRTLRTTSLLTLHQKWRGLKQGFELRRERTVGGETSVEVVYGITSLPPEQADAADLLRLMRDHWQIENGLHYVRDVTLGEDACRVRTGGGPQVLAALRNVVVHLLAQGDAPSYPAAIEQLQVQPEWARALIGVPDYE